MEIILNNSSRPFTFNFYVKGRLVTVLLPPGPSRVKVELISELEKIKTFKALKNGGTMVIGTGETEETVDAKTYVTNQKAKKLEEKPATKKAKKSSDGAVDLEKF